MKVFWLVLWLVAVSGLLFAAGCIDTAVTDFYDDAQIDSVYEAEVVETMDLRSLLRQSLKTLATLSSPSSNSRSIIFSKS